MYTTTWIIGVQFSVWNVRYFLDDFNSWSCKFYLYFVGLDRSISVWPSQFVQHCKILWRNSNVSPEDHLRLLWRALLGQSVQWILRQLCRACGSWKARCDGVSETTCGIGAATFWEGWTSDVLAGTTINCDGQNDLGKYSSFGTSHFCPRENTTSCFIA